MRKLFITLTVAIVGLTFVSCTSGYSISENNTCIMPISSTAYTMPIIAELRVSSSKISHQVTVTNSYTLKDISNFGDSPEMVYLQKLALNQAAQKYDADIIIAPSYSIVTSDDLKTITVTVTGYPASYFNIHTATAEEMDIISKNPERNMIIPCTSSSILNPTWSENYTH